jgi:hypothetical protein
LHLISSFYANLGSPRLSGLVKEEYKPVGSEIKDAPIGMQARKLILERLPLFLHEHRGSRPQVKFDWFTNEANFVIKVVPRLSLTRTLQFGGKSISKSQDASAAAKRTSWMGPVVLWISQQQPQLDLYEYVELRCLTDLIHTYCRYRVSSTMCRILFKEPKLNDSLLFMTILSTDLRALRRRGFNGTPITC